MLVAVARDKFAPGIPHPRAKPAYERLELVDALTRTYASDAHLVSYLLPAAHVVDGKQPRLRKTAPNHILDATVFTTIFIDVDNLGHQPWTADLHGAALARYASIPLPVGVYHTAKGARLVLPLAEPVPVADAEPLIRRALSIVDAVLPGVDHSAKDWTRHFRLPNVRRDGRPFVTPYIDLSRMAPVTLEPLVIPTRARSPRSRRAPLEPIPFTPTVAEHWQQRARTIGAVVADTVPSGTWHVLFLAIAGAMLTTQTPPEYVPELVRLTATAARSSNPAHHELSARQTVARYLAGHSVTGMRDLVVRWPSVADAVHNALADAVRLVTPVAPPMLPAEPSELAKTTAALERAIAQASDGLSVVVAACGLGKTHAAQRVAAARATAKNPAAKRAPAQTKTAISVDKNELAVQIATDLAAQNIPVRRLFGPLSVLDARGEPVCKFAGKALPLVEGGQSVTWEFCLGRGRYKCEHYETCPARDGEQLYGPAATTATPRVTVGTHALLRELDDAAGSTGLLVIDEPPALLETMTITADDLEHAIHNVHAFERSYADAMSPVLLALRDWVNPERDWTNHELTFADLTDTLDPPPEDAVPPPMRSATAHKCRADITVARIIGAASRTLRALHRAMTSIDARVRLDDEPRRIVVSAPRDALARALRREGAIVAMDANADLHLPGFAKVVGYAPPVSRFDAPDGAPIERTMLRAGSATRRSWIAAGHLVLDTGLLVALRAVASWATDIASRLGRPVSLGIISVRLVEIAIRAATGEDVTREWIAAGQRMTTLRNAVDQLRDVFGASVETVSTAHYGATRGLNRLAGVDCLATVGDPWPNLGDVQTEADYLDVNWEARADAIAAAELEQAHGRLRVVHRTAPGFAFHVGRVVPGGSGWAPGAPVRFDALQGGRPAAGAPMPHTELQSIVERHGGARATARAVGCSHQSILRYLDGQGVPPGVASALRAVSTGGP